ncbi:MAG: hypothetical protein JXA23_09495 [Bacteroidales bacterium]|nr:hypothetical protein [Bacteroidales bacterium]
MIFLFVEGYGDARAASNLVTRLWADLALPFIPIDTGKRLPNLNVNKGIQRAVDLIRTKSNADGLLIIRDDEDHCPAEIVKERTDFIRSLAPPFPVAYLIMYREFETLFLPGLHLFAGMTIMHEQGAGGVRISDDVNFEGNPEEFRDAKGIISRFYPGNKRYKPTLDQLPLTRLLDFNLLRASGLPCFGTLERCLHHLSANQNTGKVYP